MNQEKSEEDHSRTKGQTLNTIVQQHSSATANDLTEGLPCGGKHTDATNKSDEERWGDANMNRKNDNSPKACFKESTSSLSSASAKSRRKSATKSTNASNEKVTNLSMNDSAGSTKRLFEETSVTAVAGSSSNSASSNGEQNAQLDSKITHTPDVAVETANDNNNREDMEVEEINARASQDSDNSSNDTKKIKFEARHHSMIERRSKRQRGSFLSHRYSPGEGGGLASKKHKVNNNNNNGDDDDGVGNASIGDAVANLSSSTSSSSGGDGRVRGKKASNGKARQGKGGNNGPGPKQQIPASRQWSEPIYRWIDEGVRTDTTVDHEGVEIDFTDTKTSDWSPPPAFIVRTGDVVLLSSGGATPWNAAKVAKEKGNAQGKSHRKQREVVPIYDDPASRDAGFGALDPYIGLVERLWEDVDVDSSRKGGQRKKKGRSSAAKAPTKSSRILIRTRWLFKKENVEGLKGNFVVEGGTAGGNSKEEIMATMAPRDLVLTNQSDNNEISTVLGKIMVVKRKPLDPLSSSKNLQMKNANKGVFVCRYDLSFCPEKPSEGKGPMVVKLFPCADEVGNDESSQAIAGGIGSTKRETKEVDSSERTNTNADGSDGQPSTTGSNNHAAPAATLSSPFPPRRALVAEGLTTIGKIKVGPNHQATIPEQLDLARKTSFRGLANPPSQRIPTMVWDPAADENESVDEFLEEARCLLLGHLKTMGLEPFHDVNCIESPNVNVEAKNPREINVDRLLTELHECKGNARRAIKKISSNPEKYMAVWTLQEKEQFDAGYRTYRESIRMIATSFGKSKSCKDTVDYQYRFKLVENFRRFQRKKREKAEEIMATVEDRMLNEKTKAEQKKSRAGTIIEAATESSSSEEEEGKAVSSSANSGSGIGGKTVGSKLIAMPATRGAGPVNNRIRTWFRTGGRSSGDENVVGATQQRRNRACDFLTQVRERVGGDAYAVLARSLVACNSGVATDDSLVEVKSAAREVMKAHPDLLERFVAFLPKEVRSI